jgi:C-terminal processing protease CtpA/Prc
VPLLRIYSFDIDDDEAFIAELLRLLPLLPQEGLIIDVRDNPGGNIWAAERALQLFARRPIVPTRFSVLATPFTRALAATAGLGRDELAPWRASLDAAVRNGELYSRALPITPPERANAIGRVYPGPALLVANANTYSSGDLFTAGFVDNAIGPVICVGQATAGGGANVLDYEVLADALAGGAFALPTLPDGIGLSISFRRATRAGPSEGLPIEDVGIEGDESYAMTRDDVLHGNRDLYARCAATLAKLR